MPHDKKKGRLWQRDAESPILQLHRDVTVILDRAGVVVVPVVEEAHRQDFLSSRRSEMIGKD